VRMVRSGSLSVTSAAIRFVPDLSDVSSFADMIHAINDGSAAAAAAAADAAAAPVAPPTAVALSTATTSKRTAGKSIASCQMLRMPLPFRIARAAAFRTARPGGVPVFGLERFGVQMELLRENARILARS